MEMKGSRPPDETRTTRQYTSLRLGPSRPAPGGGEGKLPGLVGFVPSLLATHELAEGHRAWIVLA